LIANATNALALWPSAGAAAIGYARDIDTPRRLMIGLTIMSLIGAIAGALLLLLTPEARFAEAVPWIMLAATLIFTFGRRLIGPPRPRPFAIALAIQLIVAIYGGYFGGGMGILMLAAFALAGMENIHAMNGLRSILAAIINGTAVIAFVAAGKIAWIPAIA